MSNEAIYGREAEMLANLRDINKEFLAPREFVGLQVVETGQPAPLSRQYRLVIAKMATRGKPRMIDCFFNRRDCAVAVASILEFLRR